LRVLTVCIAAQCTSVVADVSRVDKST
jgi:hypothetical protein